VTGNNGLCRRKVFELIRFDITLCEAEDVALNYAMKQPGLPIATVPTLLIEHWEDKSSGTSLRWLFDNGVGATRQLLTHHDIRQPDCVGGGFVAAAAVSAFHVIPGHRLGSALPLGFVLAAGAQHVRNRVEMPLTDWHRLAPAVAAHSPLLTACLLGPLVGLSRLRRRSCSRRNQEVALAL
jgi:hypothetical protein